jgi:type III pantothenate kinase
MIILGDIGNTETKICLVKNDRIIKKILIPSKGKKTHILDKNFKKFQFTKLEKILFCSVVPSSFKELKNYFAKKTKIRCFELKELDLRSILKINVNYKQVGSDRLANAISVSTSNKNFIILDFGTATTFDVLIGNNYKGGVISPGLKLSLNSLSDKASLIPKINLRKMSKVIGKNTKSAVRSGFFWGYTGLIDNIVNLIKKESKKSFEVIITGGFSKLFRNSIKTKVKQDFDITINGLIKASKLIK